MFEQTSKNAGKKARHMECAIPYIDHLHYYHRKSFEFSVHQMSSINVTESILQAMCPETDLPKL